MRAGGERVFVGIGANLGDCVASFVSVAVQLEREAEIVILAASPLYETPPLGPAGQPPYLNAMLELRVWLSPLDFLRKLQEIETALGRERGPDCVKWGPRVIDLDVVLFGDRRIDHPDLVIPHPHIPAPSCGSSDPLRHPNHQTHETHAPAHTVPPQALPAPPCPVWHEQLCRGPMDQLDE